MLGISNNEFFLKLEETYLGCTIYEGTPQLGKYFYLLMKGELSSGLIRQLQQHKDFVWLHTPNSTHMLFGFKIGDNNYETIVKPFIQGKYSQIDRSYVDTHFTKYTSKGEISVNWRILHKDVALKVYWENRIDVTLPDDAEVWSKIKEEDEIFSEWGSLSLN
jgi:hypothetical protein